MHSSCDISALLLLVFHKKNRADVIFLMKFSSTRDLGKVEIFLFQCEMKGGVESGVEDVEGGALAGSVLSALWGSREKARRASISVANGTERAAEKAWTALTACVPSLHAETRGGAIASYGKPEQIHSFPFCLLFSEN